MNTRQRLAKTTPQTTTLVSADSKSKRRSVSESTIESGYICEICKNSNKLRNYRLGEEIDSLFENFKSINEKFSENVNVVDNFNDSMRFVILNDGFKSYQNDMAEIKICINELTEKSDNLEVKISKQCTDRSSVPGCDSRIQSIEQLCENIEKQINELSSQPTNATVKPSLFPKTFSQITEPDVTNPTNPYENYYPDFMDNDYINRLCSYLNNQNFNKKGS